MKKLLAFVMALAIMPSLHADEGMWMLPSLKKMNSKDMKKHGLEIKADQIYNENKPSIKDAVVHFGSGCTGEIISDRGLLVTNHHCGYSSIQGLSTPEHNYLEDGYWAMSLEEEIPVPGLTVTFLQSMTDVTGMKQEKADTLLARLKRENPDCSVRYQEFYNGNEIFIVVNKTYKDVRFVGAPPASAGKFGGETDNWMWPRHTCDFSMFRVYTAPDGSSAEYSKENIPLRPKYYLPVSVKGYTEGDFAMIMGYPGRTQRFQTAAQLQQMMEVQDVRIAARTVRQEVMWEWMEKNDTVRLKYANKYASSANGWKKWQGMRECFADLDVIARQQQKEVEFIEWVNKKAKRAEKYAGAIEEIEKGTQASTEYALRNALLTESVRRIELVFGNPNVDYDEDLDRDMAKAMIKFYTENCDPKDSLDLSWVNVDTLFKYRDKETMERLRSEVTAAAARIRKVYPEFSQEYEAAPKAYTAGQMEWNRSKKSYPDANSTCRLTYGNIMGYTTKQGVKHTYYTSMQGVMDKEDPTNYEFRVPARQKELFLNKDFGQYAGPDGDVPVCFLTNLDITGGNSGSPVLDAQGNLIGLAFDGNWEAMSGDVIFEPQLQRCICVDIRYVLWMMDKFGGASYLLDEMKVVK